MRSLNLCLVTKTAKEVYLDDLEVLLGSAEFGPLPLSLLSTPRQSFECNSLDSTLVVYG